MKRIFALLSFLIFIISYSFAQDVVNLNFKYQFFDSREGFVKLSKLVIKANGKKIGESPAKLENVENKVSIQIPKGKYEINASVYSMHDGVWEERTEANDYTMDCIYIDSLLLESDYNISLTFNAVTGSKNVDVEEVEIENPSNISIDNPQTALKKVNDYLKTFDNGYYGYLEVIDGYLYDRFASGKYTKTAISNLGKAVEVSENKVAIMCKNELECVYSTYTNSNHKQMSFSQNSSFNPSTLVDLLNNLVVALNNKSSNANLGENKSNNILSSNVKKFTDAEFLAACKSELDELNKFLETFDKGYYGYLEIKDGFLYDRFLAKKYNSMPIDSLGYVVIDEEYNRVLLDCKNNSNCSFSTFNNKYYDGMSFSQSTSYDKYKLATLINNLVNKLRNPNDNKGISPLAIKTKNGNTEVQGNSEVVNSNFSSYDDEVNIALSNLFDTPIAPKTTPSNNSSQGSNYKTPLNELNTFLNTYYNPEIDNNVEVINTSVYFNFLVDGDNYSSSIKMADLKKYVTVNVTASEVKLQCNNSQKLFYSTYADATYDYFSFTAPDNANKEKLAKLLSDFIKAL
ncbi:MAG: hypothetical protein M9888_05875 [Chitinophagales bacterium]|nr:hypothetical protein [Chitinophagales bacterium]